MARSRAALLPELLDGSQRRRWGVESGDKLRWELRVRCKLGPKTMEVTASHAGCEDVTTVTVSWGNGQSPLWLTRSPSSMQSNIPSFAAGCGGGEGNGNHDCIPQANMCYPHRICTGLIATSHKFMPSLPVPPERASRSAQRLPKHKMGQGAW